MPEDHEIHYSMYTFQSTDGKITASVQMDANGDLFIQMKPQGRFTEKEMYELLEGFGLRETLEPLRGKCQ